ncbi:phosphoribosylglycinamide formyltransferase [Bdellovibrio sp. BCCA]|uniref:phosphoribosylglycinamide formyltransferase n=1 Tax=Bdellovibrio sp. BCCA TaxID=3136281 RepID=UPI0030F234B2
MRPPRIAIFASGKGSNAMALIQKAKVFSEGQVEISFVLSDKTDALVLEKAKNDGIRTYLVPKRSDKKSHEKEILGLVREHRIDWIFLAGYMRLLSADFLKTFSEWHNGASQVVNIHPSLLPAYPGVDSIARAYQDEVPLSGVSIHLVDEGMDTGLILAQESLVRNSQDSLEAWEARIHELEHRMYTGFLESLATFQRRTVYFQENP